MLTVASGFEWKNACGNFGLYLQLYQHQGPKSNARLALFSNKFEVILDNCPNFDIFLDSD